MNIAFQKDQRKNNWFKDKFNVVIDKIKNFKLPTTVAYFLILLVIGFGFYLWMLAENNFTLAYGGDYSAQYIPMGYHVWDYYHDWIHTGHFTLFDTTLYLGANSIGSNAYYGLFSPFNIIIVLLPRSFVPHSIAICSIIKLACAGLFFNFFMVNAFNVKGNIGRLCGVAYAFCGWGAFYLWYNNYQDILVFFPLILWGIEKTIKEQKPWLLATGVFFLTICNYVLMVPYIICAFLYAMFRFFQQVNKHTIKENFITLGLGVLGFAGGLLMSMFVFLPAFMATMSSPKLDTNSYGGMLKEYLLNKDFDNFFKLLFSWESAADQHGYIIPVRVYYPILEFFFPATTCRSLPTNEFQGWDFDDMAVSLWCYIPFIMFLVPALIQSGQEKKWSHYVGFALLTLSLFTPFMYYVTMGFTNGYARWTLFVIACLIIYVGIYIDKIPNVAKWHIHVGYTFAIAGIIAAWLLCYKLEGKYVYTKPLDTLLQSDRSYTFRFIEDDGSNFTNIAYIVELIYTTAVYLTLLVTFNKKAFSIFATVFVSAEAIAMGNFVTLGHGWDASYNNGYAQNERFKYVLDKVKENDDSYYRIYTSIGDAYSSNNSFINNYNSVGFFHSLYNFEIDDFTLWTGLRNGSKSVAGDYRGKYQDVDNLLGVKYYFVSKEKSKYNAIEAFNPGGFIGNVPFDFERNEEYEKYTNDYLVYENKNLSKFGYSYSHIYDNLYDETCGKNEAGEITVKYAYTNSNMNIRHAMMMSTDAMLTKEDAAEIKENYPSIELDTVKPDTTTLKYTYPNSDYAVDYYDISKVYGEFNIGAAKQYPFDKIASIPDVLTPTSYNRNQPDDPNASKAMDYFAFYHSRFEGQPLFKAGTALYADAPFSGSQKYNFYFIGEDGKIFMFDAHDDDTTDNTSIVRGFYIKKDVYSIAIVGKYYQSYFKTSYGGDEISFSIENFNDYETRRNKLNENPIENVTYQSDEFTFETHYEKDMLVVSRVAFDKGWSVTATNIDTGEIIPLKTYRGNGAFVSFVAPKGNYSYKMVYKTPYLDIGYIVTAFSITSFFVSMFGYHLYQEKKKIKHIDSLFRNN